MRTDLSRTCTAFADKERVASGTPLDVVLVCKALVDANDGRAFLVFDDESADQLEIDLRGTPQDVLQRFAVDSATSVPEEEEPVAPRSPGRPKLGVVGREVTLLPRHWEWLNAQPGGASVALRRLVERARREYASQDRIRQAQESAFRFMSAMAGDEPGFEEASRALFAGDRERFRTQVAGWPADVAAHATALAEHAFAEDE